MKKEYVKFFVLICAAISLFTSVIIIQKYSISEYINEEKNKNKDPEEPDFYEPEGTGETIPVIFALDNNYVYPTYIAMFSMLENSGRDTFYKISALVSEDFTNENKDKILYLKKLYENCEINFINMKNEFDNTPIAKVGGQLTKETLFRLRIPSLFKDEKKIIYLDGDIFVAQDLSDMYRYDIGSNYIGGAPDDRRDKSGGIIGERTFLMMESLDQYVNAGVLLWNLEESRKDNIEEKFFNLLVEHNGLPQNDQSAINMVCYGKIFTLPFRYNMQTYMTKVNKRALDKDDWLSAKKHPVIVHYASEKPWKNPYVMFSEKWWQAAKKTTYWQEIEKKYFDALSDKNKEKVKSYLK